MKRSMMLFGFAIFMAWSTQCFAQMLSHTFVYQESSFPGSEQSVENRKIWISPSLNLDLYVEETDTHRSQSGVVPGVGYGIRWNPSWWKDKGADIKSKSLLSLDVYIQGSFVDEIDEFEGNDYFAIDVLPAITIMDWVSIGYGHRWKRSQHSDLENENTPILSFGIRKAL